MLRQDFERKVWIKAQDIATDTMLKKQYEDYYEPFFDHADQDRLRSELIKHTEELLLAAKAGVAKIVSEQLSQNNPQEALKMALSEYMLVLGQKANDVIQKINQEMKTRPVDIKQLLKFDLERKVVNYMINDINSIIPSKEDTDSVLLVKEILAQEPQLDDQTRSILYRESLTRNRSHKNNTERMIRLLKEKGGGFQAKRERRSTFKAQVNTYQSARKYSNDRLPFFKDPSAKLLEQLKVRIADYANVYVTNRFSEEKMAPKNKPMR